MPTNDEIVQMMLGQQPAVSGPLPQQAPSPQPTQPQSQAEPQPLTFDDHMERIRQFWAGQGQPSMLNDNPHGYGNGAALAEQPTPQQPAQMSPGEAVLHLIRGAAMTEPNKLAGTLNDAVQPAKRLFIDGGWQRGPDDPQAAADMRNILLSSGLGTSVAPVAPPDALGVFAGIKGAENMAEAGLRSPNALGGANRLRWARMREASGMAPEDIWDRHGWFRDADGRWKMEIADDPLRANMDSVQSGGLNNPQGEIYHPLVAAAYPEVSDRLANWLERSPTVDGSEARRGKGGGLSLSVFAPDENKARSVAAHEINHLIASREGFDTGLPSTHPDYWFSTGEAAARNVQNRLGMSPLDRRFTYPGETSDIPFDMQVRTPDSGEDFLGNIDPDLRAKILDAADKGMAPSAIADEMGISSILAGAVISAGKRAAPKPKYLGGGAPGDWTGGMEATLEDLTAKGGLTAQQMADAINEKHGLSVTANAVRQKMSQTREEKTPVRARWPEPAKAWLQSPEAGGLSHREAADALNEKFGLETTPATVQNARARLKKVSQ
jgi:transposase